ncbi:MAG: dicarboxylate/amino acid:cation symporter, partial [Acidobacteria bacterium]|nr:dicarboxylate/amino acid:cation symporter [Acidobacteriota bacterium]
TLLPLIVSQLLSSIVSAGAEPGASVGRLGFRAILLFVVMLAMAGIVTAIITPPLLSFYRVDPAMVQSLAGMRSVANVPAAQAASGDWSKSLPTNLVESARKGEILPILIFAALVGAAITRLRDEYRGPLTQLLRGSAEAMMSVVRWILLGTPVGVFALTYVASLHAGGRAAGMMGAFILLVCVELALFIVLLYPLTAMAGRTSMRDFARAAAPAQLVAISTMSSIAALPALIQGGLDHLRLPPRVSGFVLPLSVSIFKLNRTVSATAKLLFLAHVYGMQLSAGTLAVFMVSVILLSFGTVGVPQGGQAFTTLPAYLAAGIPAEGVILLEATAIAPDMLKTLLNVTGDMSVAALLSRGSRRGAAAVTTDPPAVPPDGVPELASEGAR